MGVRAVGTSSYLEGDTRRWREMTGQEEISPAWGCAPAACASLGPAALMRSHVQEQVNEAGSSEIEK